MIGNAGQLPGFANEGLSTSLGLQALQEVVSIDRDITDEDINLLGIKREIFNSTGRDPITGVPLPPFRQY